MYVNKANLLSHTSPLFSTRMYLINKILGYASLTATLLFRNVRHMEVCPQVGPVTIIEIKQADFHSYCWPFELHEHCLIGFFNFIFNILWTCVELLKSLYLKGIWGTINTILSLYFDMLVKQDLPRIHCHMLNHFFSNLQTNKTEGHRLWVYILFLLRCAPNEWDPFVIITRYFTKRRIRYLTTYTK